MIALQALRDTAERAARLMADNLDDRGRLDSAANSIYAYFKVIVGLVANSRHREAALVCNWLREHFEHDGDYCRAEGDETTSRLYYYRNAWVSYGMTLIGQHGAARKTNTMIEQAMHPVLGGLPDQPLARIEDQSVEMGGTCCAAHAFLCAGRVDLAVRAMSFVEHLIDAQAGRDDFILLADWSGKPLAADDRRITLEPGYSIIRIGKPTQPFWYFAFTLRNCARLVDITGDERWLSLAERTRQLIERCGEAIYDSITTSKMSWGASDMFSVTGDTRYRDMALRCVDWIIRKQVPEGTWIRKPGDTFATQTLISSMETASERAYTLREVERALTIGGHRWS